MKKTFIAILMTGCLHVVMAQDNTALYYLPGDGVYLVGLPSDLNPVVTEPTMVTQAYRATFYTYNAELAATSSGDKSYNVGKYYTADKSQLDLTRFMGIGEISSLLIRDFEGGKYELGSYAPVGQKHSRLLAAYNSWEGNATLPLCMYDQWDCPISFEVDPMLAEGRYDAVTVQFSNAHEGLVVGNVNFPLAVAAGSDLSKSLQVTLTVDGLPQELTTTIQPTRLDKVASYEGYDIYSAVAFVSAYRMVIDTTFQVTVSGLVQEGLNAWIPRAIDTHHLYPSHTLYSGVQEPVQVDSTDVCINVEGYFNYIGTYGWYDGKYERGEVVGSADLVQIYYDPADADWPGDYYMGEASFPVECTFGSSDIVIQEMPEWINSISYDDSQWEEYGGVQIILAADALPSDLSGRNGKVVLSTSDGASLYTIYIRQGAAWFDFTDDIKGCPVVNVATEGGTYDLSGRRVVKQDKGLCIKNNTVILNK